MEYKKGLRVRHPTVPNWGVGEVLEDRSGDLVRVFFVGCGEKKLSLKGLELLKVEGEEALHPILENLKVIKDGGLRYKSLPESIEKFLTEFPAGFYGEKFAAKERNYKVNAHTLMTELLNEHEFKRLLGSNDYNEVCRLAIKVINSTNLVFPNEKMSLKDGLQSAERKKQFSEVLWNHLFGEDPLDKRFLELCTFLDEIKAAKWTIATYFLFFMFPKEHMFIKPTITQNSAEICGFDIHYRSELNWKTYEAVLKFSEFLKKELIELKPRDMIDVQSFMWCIRADKTLKKFGKKENVKQTDGQE